VEEELGTKGTFSRNARAEAIPDGVPAINLIDGQEVVSLLKRYELGVRMVMGAESVGGEWREG
jgi:restriction system protein